MFDVEDKIKWNDLAKSLQDIIMRKIGYDDLDKSIKDKLASSADSSILADVFASGMDGQWEVKGKMHELLPDKIFLYNTRLEKLYFYKFWNNYQLIEAY